MGWSCTRTIGRQSRGIEQPSAGGIVELGLPSQPTLQCGVRAISRASTTFREASIVAATWQQRGQASSREGWFQNRAGRIQQDGAHYASHRHHSRMLCPKQRTARTCSLTYSRDRRMKAAMTGWWSAQHTTVASTHLMKHSNNDTGVAAGWSARPWPVGAGPSTRRHSPDMESPNALLYAIRRIAPSLSSR